MLLNLTIFIIACIVLAKSAQLIIKTLVKLEKILHLTDFSIGFIFMAVATTLPELLVGINAAIKNNTALALGNVIGSNIVNLTLILGIVIILSKKISTKTDLIEKNTFYMFLISLLPLLLMLDSTISRSEGLILILIFIFYIFKLTKHKLPKINNHYKSTKKNFLIFIIGIFLLISSSYLVVEYATKLAVDLLLPPILIGLFLIAIGTSLPELAFGVKASLKRHPKLSLGNLTGSVIVNSTLVLGTTALIRPITADFRLFLVASLFLILTSYLFFIFSKTDKKLTLKEGIVLILIYIAFLATEFILK